MRKPSSSNRVSAIQRCETMVMSSGSAGRLLGCFPPEPQTLFTSPCKVEVDRKAVGRGWRTHHPPPRSATPPLSRVWRAHLTSNDRTNTSYTVTHDYSSLASTHANAGETTGEASVRDVLEGPNTFPNWKRAIGLMQSSPNKDQTRGPGDPAPPKAKRRWNRPIRGPYPAAQAHIT